MLARSSHYDQRCAGSAENLGVRRRLEKLILPQIEKANVFQLYAAGGRGTVCVGQPETARDQPF